MNAQSKVEPSLASAYIAAFADIEGVTKDALGQVGQQKYKYADLGSVIGAIKPVLIRHGLAFTQPCEPSPSGVTVRTVLHHGSGETMDLGSLFVPANKQDAQGFGSALTYARRYALVSAFGVPTEDDDGKAASASVNRQHTAAATIDQAQFEELESLMARSGTTAETICKGYGIAAVAMLPASKFPKLKERLEATAIELERTAA
ncbi:MULTISPECIES: ERF family protein [Alphaproteobacteria]|uniref:ERF family protein n=1 Tax=Sphingopyxis sp. TaxID=1908224 RepID=UPI004034AA7E